MASAVSAACATNNATTPLPMLPVPSVRSCGEETTVQWCTWGKRHVFSFRHNLTSRFQENMTSTCSLARVPIHLSVSISLCVIFQSPQQLTLPHTYTHRHVSLPKCLRPSNASCLSVCVCQREKEKREIINTHAKEHVWGINGNIRRRKRKIRY